jgi:hypothetical protein
MSTTKRSSSSAVEKLPYKYSIIPILHAVCTQEKKESAHGIIKK